MVKEAHNLTLKQCLAIKENQYRSKDCKHEYYPESIEERISMILTNKHQKLVLDILNALETASDELPPPIPSECDEGLDAQWDYMNQDNEYIKMMKPNGFSYQWILVPPVICPF